MPPQTTLLALALLLCPPALATVVWRGDFETGDLSQWSRTQAVSADRLAVVPSPVSEGKFALKVTVRQGDDPINASGDRAELLYTAPEVAGTERYYRWSTFWAANYPSASTWQLFTQWHHSGSSGSPPVEFYVYGEEVRLRVGGSGSPIIWKAPLVRGKWREFIFHVKWSSNPSVGFVELYLDGQLVLPKKNAVTMFAGQTNYLKQGLYRNSTIAQEGVLFHDGMMLATLLSDVLSSTPPPPPPPPPPTQKPAAVVVDASIKVRPSESPPGSPKATLTAARSEVEPFQVVVHGGSSGATGVSAAAGELKGPCGSIPASSVRLYRVGYLQLTTPSSAEGGTGRWPDPLIPDVDEVALEKRAAFPFAVPANENRVVYAEVQVPPDAAPGPYSGTLTVSGGGLGSVAIPVELLVVDLAMPKSSSLPTSFGLNEADACAAHFGSPAACTAEEADRLRLRYARFLLDHRVSADAVRGGPVEEGSGWNWAAFDARNSPLLDGTAPGLLEGARLGSARLPWRTAVDPLRAWTDHLKSRGWLDRAFDFSCDEPPSTCAWADITSRAALVHAADPGMRTLVTASLQDAAQNGVLGAVDILAPTVNQMHDKPGFGSAYEGNQRPTYDGFLADPKRRLYWRQTCQSHGCNVVGGSYHSGWPSYVIDATGVQNRAMGWLAFSYGIGGELYHRTTHRLKDAWSTVYAFGGNGDGTLLYPGTPAAIGGASHVPVASLRLKMIREGLEDYELLRRVADLGDGAFARSIASGLFPAAYQARQPAEKLAEARGLVIQRLLALEGKSAANPSSALCQTGAPTVEQPPALPSEPGATEEVEDARDQAPPGVLGRIGCSSAPGLLAIALAIWAVVLCPRRSQRKVRLFHRHAAKTPSAGSAAQDESHTRVGGRLSKQSVSAASARRRLSTFWTAACRSPLPAAAHPAPRPLPDPAPDAVPDGPRTRP
ncbi:MAG: heparin lyase I family protein [Myxococcales bacterium]|nr:heparin lyase I family protein [Myxococcales bacterium]